MSAHNYIQITVHRIKLHGLTAQLPRIIKNGTIANFTFEIKDNAKVGSTNVKLSFTDSYDTDYAENNFSAISCKIDVGCKNHTFGNYTNVSASTHKHICSACGFEETKNHTLYFYIKIISLFTISKARFRMLFILPTLAIWSVAFNCSVTSSVTAICITRRSNIFSACRSMSAR